MTGQVKKTEGPDPSPCLVAQSEPKEKLTARVCKSKKSRWVLNKVTVGYDEVLTKNTDGDKISVISFESGHVSKKSKKMKCTDDICGLDAPHY